MHHDLVLEAIVLVPGHIIAVPGLVPVHIILVVGHVLVVTLVTGVDIDVAGLEAVDMVIVALIINLAYLHVAAIIVAEEATITETQGMDTETIEDVVDLVTIIGDDDHVDVSIEVVAIEIIVIEDMIEAVPEIEAGQ